MLLHIMISGNFSIGFRVGLSAGRRGVMSSIPCQVQFLHKLAPSLKTFISCCLSPVTHYEGALDEFEEFCIHFLSFLVLSASLHIQRKLFALYVWTTFERKDGKKFYFNHGPTDEPRNIHAALTNLLCIARKYLSPFADL